MLPSCSSIHTWNLLETNRRAFGSWLILLVVTFQEQSLQDHVDLYPAAEEDAMVAAMSMRAPKSRLCGVVTHQGAARPKSSSAACAGRGYFTSLCSSSVATEAE